ncbi:MAG: WD40 repeat domain-containing protein [Polyangiales bacterium]
MALPAGIDAARRDGPWSLWRVFGDWRGRTLYRDLAWVAPDGSVAVSVRAWGGDAWDDSELAWTVLDLADGAPRAHGRVSLSQDPVVELRFDDDGAAVRVLDGGDRVMRVAFARATVTAGFAPSRWDLDRARVEAAQARHPDLTLWGVDATGRWALASEPLTQTVLRLDLRSGERTAWHTGHAASVASVAFSADGEQLASAGQFEHARVWSLHDDRPLWTFEPPSVSTLALCFDLDGRHLSAWSAPAEGPGSFARWSLRDGEARAAMALPPAPVESGEGCLSPDGEVLARLAPSGREVVLRRLHDDPRPVVRRVPFAMRAAALRFVGHGRALRLLGVDGARWCVGDVDAAASLDAERAAVPSGPIRALEVAQEFGEAYVADDGTRALLPDGTGLRWCDLETGEAGARIPRGVDAPESAVAMSVHPDRVAFARDARLELWDAAGAREATLDLSAMHDLVSALAFDPTGTTLAVGTALGVVLVYRRAR